MNTTLRTHSLRTVALASVLGLTGMQAGAATLIPVPPVSGSLGTVVFDINDNNIITGSYYDTQGSEHGFFGPLDGSYTTFDYTENPSIGTEPRGINNGGYIVGHAPIDNFGNNYEFVRNPDGSILTVTKDGAPVDGFLAQGINSANEFVGDYTPDGSTLRAYLGQDGAWKADLSLPFGMDDTLGRGINNVGAMVGYFFDSAGHRHGFLLQNGVAKQIDYPSPDQTVLDDINDKGIAVGQVLGTRFFAKSFILDTNTNTFQPIQWPRQAQALGVNNSGLVAIDILDGSNPGPYIYCPTSMKHCPASAGRIRIPDPTPMHRSADHLGSYIVSRAGVKDVGKRKRLGEIRTRFRGRPGLIEP